MSGLRIALVASNSHPIAQPFAGGLEAHVWLLARALRDRGHRVTLFAAPGSDPGSGADSIAVRDLTLSTAAVQDISMPSPQFLIDHHAYLGLMVDLISSGAASFDVVHNHSLHYLPLAMAPALTVPMLTTLHTPPTPWLESALHITGGHGSEFAAVSRYTAAAWRHAVGDIGIVGNGIDTRCWPVGDGGDDLVWSGRITPEKAPHLAIDVARRAGRRLHLAGPIHDRPYFDRFIRPALDPAVVYHGHLRSDRLARLIGSCAVALITPQWDEPYGLVVAEALACGTPVVAFARGGIPEIVDETCGCLVPAGDTAAMAAAVPVAAGLRRRAARRHAETACDQVTMVEAYLDRYRRLIDTAVPELR
ncbi:glycosyltransferase [Nocardia aurantia]|uniref:Glycogen synthase n=1 Tax=Nocardia aurantia TaxID=2585199 RepID=A0A7K0DPU2_9NOCA|nr:glycosyltransferase [Nocardia aurantia]MQY27785.1 Glycogen synthase [Nocardia aurantia]